MFGGGNTHVYGNTKFHVEYRGYKIILTMEVMSGLERTRYMEYLMDDIDATIDEFEKRGLVPCEQIATTKETNDGN